MNALDQYCVFVGCWSMADTLDARGIPWCDEHRQDDAPPSTKRTPLVYPVINDPLDPCREGYDYGRPCGFACGRPYHIASPNERR